MRCQLTHMFHSRKRFYFMKFKDNYKYALPPIITAVILCIIYIVKHIYPFGINTIDYYDMAQQITSFYYHVFDVLHGEKSLFYDPYTALSVNMAMSTSGCSHISIFNLFFLFVKRDMLLESLSIFLMLKMMLMSLFMYIYIHNRFKVSTLIEMIFSVGYAFSGYVLMLYMTIHWLDVAALFPLLMYFLHKLLKEGKVAGYTIVLTICIIASYYQSFMILFYIIIMLGALVFTDRIFNDRTYENYHLVKLLISTVASIMLSSFIFVPQICQTLISARFNNENGGGLLYTYYKIVSNSKPAYTSRWFSILGLSFAFAIIVYGLIKYRKEKKVVFITILSMFLILSELLVEGVNLFWHFGSYVGYPIRNGYMINFTIAIIACGFVEKLAVDDGASKDASTDTFRFNDLLLELKKSQNLLTTILVVAAAIVLLVILNIYSRTTGLTIRNVFHLTILSMVFTFVIYMMLIAKNNSYVLHLAPVLLVAEFILFGFIMIGKPAFTTGYTEDPEQEGEHIRICSQLDEKLNLNAVSNLSENGDSLLFSRVKNPDTTLNANYGLVLRRPVLSNWKHLLSPKLQRDAKNLGYTIQYTRLLDAGGTVFSDALIGVDTVISALPLDEEMYELVDTAEVEADHISYEKATYYIYKCRYTLPFGVVTTNVDYDFENGDIVSLHNSIYKSISGDDNIANYELTSEELLGNVSSSTEDIVISKSLAVSGKKALYFYSDQVDTDDYNTEIKVNGYDTLVSSIGEIYNTKYPAHFNNNLIYLGTFENEEVDIDITSSMVNENGDEIEGEFSPNVISIDIDKLANLCASYNDRIIKRNAGKASYSFELSGVNNGEYLLLPFSYDEGYKAMLDENKVEVIPVGGMFLAIKLSDNANVVRLDFSPKGLGIGLVISAIGFALLICYYFINQKTDIVEKEYKWINVMYFAGFSLIMIFMYAVPYAFAVLSVFIR